MRSLFYNVQGANSIAVSNNVRSSDDRFSFCFFYVCFSPFQFCAVSSTISLCIYLSLLIRVFRYLKTEAVFLSRILFLLMMMMILNRVELSMFVSPIGWERTVVVEEVL